MKVKNIMFFGFAAAILSAGAANAAVTPNASEKNIVTSKFYVDSLVSDVETAVGNVDTGVMSVTESTQNGKIDVDGTQVAIHGLGSAAYTDTGAYATAAQGTTADNTAALVGNTAMTTTAQTVTAAINELDAAIGDVDTGVMSVTTGNTNGNINVDGTQVPVYGLGSAAYTNTDAYEAAGTVKNGTLTLTGSTTNTTATFGANQEGNAAFTIRDLPAKPDSCTDAAPCALVQEGSSLTWKPMAQPGA